MGRIDFVVAYANESTNYEWMMIAPHYEFESAIKHIRAIESNMTKSAMAIFSRRAEDTCHWSEKSPRRIYNRHVLTLGRNPSGLISQTLGGLINSFESVYF